jgi:hypothetical protein
MKEENSDNQLKDIFKSKFADEYLAPPKDAWSNIQGQMTKPGRVIKPLYYWLIPVGLLFIIGGGIAVNSIFSTEKAQNKSAQTQINSEENSDSKNEEDSFGNKEGKESDKDLIAPVAFDSLNEKVVSSVDKNLISQDNSENALDKKVVSKDKVSKEKNVRSITSNAEFTTESKTSNKSLTNNKSGNKLESKSKIESNKSKENSNTAVTDDEVSANLKAVTKRIVNSESNEQSVTNSEKNKVRENQAETIDGKEKTNLSNSTELGAKSTNAEMDKPKNTQQNDVTSVSKPNNSESQNKIDTIVSQKEKTKETSVDKPKESAKSNIEEEIAGTTGEEKNNQEVVKPKVTESNVLLNSVAPRNNLRYDFYMGAGKSIRNSTIYNTGETDSTLLLATNKMNMNNTVMGFNVRYQITPYFAMRSGIAVGGDRLKTQQFSVTLANTSLDQNIKIATSNGILQTTGIPSDNLNANSTDSSTFDMQIFHRQGYITIPISFVVNTKIQPGKLYYYGSTGFDFMAKGKGRNLLIVADGEETRNISLSRLTDVNKLYTNWNIAFGLAYPFQSRFDLFTEINYSLDISKRLKSSYLTTNSAYIQVLIGLRF